MTAVPEDVAARAKAYGETVRAAANKVGANADQAEVFRMFGERGYTDAYTAERARIELAALEATVAGARHLNTCEDYDDFIDARIAELRAEIERAK